MGKLSLAAGFLLIWSMSDPTKAAELAYQGRALESMPSKADIPAYIRSFLHIDDPGNAGVAEIGGNFNSGDAYIAGIPNRVLLGAGHDGDLWLVAIRGSGGFTGQMPLTVYQFEANTLVGKWELGGFFHGTMRIWNNFESLVASLDRPSLPGTLGSLSIGQTREQVTGVIGMPEMELRNDPDERTELRYADLTLWFDNGSRLVRMFTRRRSLCLTGDLCPGASLSQVQELVGPPTLSATDGSVSRYLLKASCYSDITYSGGKVQSLEVACYR